MPEYKGRLTYAKGTYVEFVIHPTQNVDFGDILVIEGQNSDRFYIRAYDFKVKSRWSNINGVNYLMSKLDENGQANEEELGFYLGGNHTAKVGIAEQLCYADNNGNLYNPKTCPDFFCQVRELTADDTELLSEVRGDLELGKLKCGRGIYDMPVGIYGYKSFTEHIGIFGTTGSGKSNVVKVLTSSIMDNGNYGVLIFDVHNEYFKALSIHPKASERLVVYNSNPSSQGVKPLVVHADEIEPEDVTACASFTEPQLDALFKMSSVWGHDWVNYVLNYEIEDLIDELKGSTGQKFQSRTISKIKSVCWNLKQELGFKDDGESSLIQMMDQLKSGKVVLIEMKNLSPVGEQALSTLLSRKLLSVYANLSENGVEDFKQVLLVLEEAHRFLGKKEHVTNNVFAKLVSEARKFHLGLCVVDQQPRLIADKVLSQLNTLFILGLASKADRNKLETMCRKDILQQRNEIKNLDCGEMIVANNYMRFAAPVKVHKFETYLAEHYGINEPMKNVMVNSLNRAEQIY